MIRVILNGKKADIPAVREAISDLRDQGHIIEVRVTWEENDIQRLVNEAAEDGVSRLVVGGGDGSINKVCDAIAQLRPNERMETAILPLGTANDLATACLIPMEPLDALKLALEEEAVPVDLGKANDHHFINIATGGFGAQVTTETPVELKNFLGGGAYTLTGIVKSLNFSPDSIQLRTPDIDEEFEVLVAAVCNGRQAGGGQQLAPLALIDDGLLDIILITRFPLVDVGVVLEEILSPDIDGQYVKRIRTPWAEALLSSGTSQINLDGEPFHASELRFEVLPGAIKLVLPKDSPVLSHHNNKGS